MIIESIRAWERGSQGNPTRATSTGPYSGFLGRLGSASLGSNGLYDMPSGWAVQLPGIW